MQAFFLVTPGRTTSGTGVFLPATASHPPTKKTACSPVLLPTRVVQALNLNIHNNGIHISPRPGSFPTIICSHRPLFKYIVLYITN